MWAEGFIRPADLGWRKYMNDYGNERSRELYDESTDDADIIGQFGYTESGYYSDVS